MDKQTQLNSRYLHTLEKSLNANSLLVEKQKSLKDQHFARFYKHLYKKIPKLSKLQSFSLANNSSKVANYQNKNYKSVTSFTYQPIVIKRNFRDPKNINYKLLKYNPYKNHLRPKINIINSDLYEFNKKEKKENYENKLKDINMITFYDIKFKKNKTKEKKIHNEENKDKNIKITYNRNKLLNNKEYIAIMNKIKEYNN